MSNSPLLPTCERALELAPAVIFGAADSDERREFDAALDACPDDNVRREIADYLRLARALEFAAPDADEAPPSGLEARIMAAVSARSATAPAADPKPAAEWTPAVPVLTISETPRVHNAAPKRSRAWPIAFAGAMAAVLVLALLNVTTFVQLSQTSLDNDLLKTQASAAQVDGEANRQLVEIARQRDAQWVTISSDASGSTFSIVYSQRANRAGISAQHLTPLSGTLERPLDVYQAWLIPADGAPISIGIFSPRLDNSAAIFFVPEAPLSDYETFAISIEPVGGSTAPTSDPIAAGPIADTNT